MARSGRTGAAATTAAGGAVGLAGLGFVGVGLLARRDVRRALARERIVDPQAADGPARFVTSAAGARALAEFVRENTIEATGGRTYAEVAAYVDAEGQPTPDAAAALKDERTGAPVENPDHDLWLQSTTLQGSLMQAYMAFRLAELVIGVGASLVAVGVGLAAAGRRCSAGRDPARG